MRGMVRACVEEGWEDCGGEDGMIDEVEVDQEDDGGR
jgi:hypothetical protein